MVFFSCGTCGDTVKKAKAPEHQWKCPRAAFSCLDCGKEFNGAEYQQHKMCISEAEKYSGKNFKAKAGANAAQSKNDHWKECLKEALKEMDMLPADRDFLSDRVCRMCLPTSQEKFQKVLIFKSGQAVMSKLVTTWFIAATKKMEEAKTASANSTNGKSECVARTNEDEKPKSASNGEMIVFTEKSKENVSLVATTGTKSKKEKKNENGNGTTEEAPRKGKKSKRSKDLGAAEVEPFREIIVSEEASCTNPEECAMVVISKKSKKNKRNGKANESVIEIPMEVEVTNGVDGERQEKDETVMTAKRIKKDKRAKKVRKGVEASLEPANGVEEGTGQGEMGVTSKKSKKNKRSGKGQAAEAPMEVKVTNGISGGQQDQDEPDVTAKISKKDKRAKKVRKGVKASMETTNAINGINGGQHDQDDTDVTAKKSKKYKRGKKDEKVVVEATMEMTNGVDAEETSKRSKKRKHSGKDHFAAIETETTNLINGKDKKKKRKHADLEADTEKEDDLHNENKSKKSKISCNTELEAPAQVETPQKKFKIETVVKQILKAADNNQISISKLKKKVLSEYLSSECPNLLSKEQLEANLLKKVTKNPAFKCLKDKVTLSCRD